MIATGEIEDDGPTFCELAGGLELIEPRRLCSSVDAHGGGSMETLIPVIVGGIIGILGTVAGPPLTHWLTQGAERQKKRADKLEQFMNALYAYDHCLGVIRAINVFGHEQAEPPSPFAKAQAIASIYFPEFELTLRDLNVRALAYEGWMIEAGQKRLAGKHSEVSEGFNEVYAPYLVALRDVLDAATTLARTEFGEPKTHSACQKLAQIWRRRRA
jgi:hypothetical protein